MLSDASLSGTRRAVTVTASRCHKRATINAFKRSCFALHIPILLDILEAAYYNDNLARRVVLRQLRACLPGMRHIMMRHMQHFSALRDRLQVFRPRRRSQDRRDHEHDEAVTRRRLCWNLVLQRLNRSAGTSFFRFFITSPLTSLSTSLVARCSSNNRNIQCRPHS